MSLDFQHNFKLSLLANIKTSCVLVASDAEAIESDKLAVIKDVSSQFIVHDFQFEGNELLSLADISLALCEKANSLNTPYSPDVLDGIKNIDRKILVLARILHNVVIVIHDADKVKSKLIRAMQKLCLVLDYHSCVDFRLVLIGDESLIGKGQAAEARFDYVNFHFEGFSGDKEQELARVISAEKILERRSIKRYFYEYTYLLEKTPKLKSFLLD